MPVKINVRKVSSKSEASGHPGSVPIGVITGMEKKTLEDGTNQLIAQALLWADEYPTEVQFLKDAFASGEAPGISWELGYKSTILENGINWLKSVITRAATFVKSPAYGTRTALLALASIEDVEEIRENVLALAEELKNSVTPIPQETLAETSKGVKEELVMAVIDQKASSEENEGGKKMELEQALAALKNAEAEVEQAKTDLIAKAQELSQKEDDLKSKDSEISTLNEKLAELTKVNTAETRIRLFTEAGLRLDEDAEKASKKRDFIASFTDTQWDEYLDEKVADLKALSDSKKVTAGDLSRAAASTRNNFPKVEGKVLDNKDLKELMRTLSRE